MPEETPEIVYTEDGSVTITAPVATVEIEEGEQ